MAWATRFSGRDPKVSGSTAATLREHGLLGSPPAHNPGNPLSKLSNSAWAAALPEWARERYEERAAIQEHDGKLARNEAERRARAAIEAHPCTEGLRE